METTSVPCQQATNYYFYGTHASNLLMMISYKSELVAVLKEHCNYLFSICATSTSK